MDDLFITKKLKYTTLKKTIQYESLLINYGTIDSIHNKFMDDFEKRKKSVPKIQQKIESLKKEHEILEQKHPNLYTISDISKKADIKEKIENYEEVVEKINSSCDELDYFTRSLHILTQYYGVNRNTTIPDTVVTNNINNTSNKGTSLLDFFNTAKKNKDKNIQNDSDNILEEYLKCTMNKTIKKRFLQTQICPDCNVEKILQSGDGHMVCMECGHSDQIIVDMEKINFKDPFYENKSTGYKRMNHFSELMNQFQAKESTDIPSSIFNLIISEIKKQKITNPVDLNKKRMRTILKKLELNQYFEHIPFIINRLTELPPPTITRDSEEKLKSMFKEIQKPFKMYRPKQRKNFLNYNYVFHKFFELLEMDQFLPHFPLLKSASKLREQDELWEKICKYLKWEFIPST
jgi:Zn ribbon nucleic-acid-binding protein